MKVIISTNSPTLKSAIAKKLIPLGVTTITLNTLEELEDLIPFISKICFIDEIAFPMKDLLPLVEKIKKNHPDEGIRLILLTKNTDPQSFKLFTVKGIDAIIQNSLHTDTIAERFSAFVNKFCGQDARRKYLRINLSPNESSSVKILIPTTQQYIEGKITDISMGGFAAEFDAEGLSKVNENIVYSRTQVIIEHKNIISDIKLMKKGTTLAAFSFFKLPDSFRDTLAEYILSKIQNYIEGTSSES